MKSLFKFTILLLLVGIGAVAESATECSDPKTIRFAVFPKKDIDIQLREYAPLIDLLEKSTARRVDLVRTTSYGSAVEGLIAGRIDLAELGPAAYAMAKGRDIRITAFASSSLVSGTYTDSTSHYRSVLLVKRGGRFDSVNSLKGASIGLIDPVSTSGALIPQKAISEMTGFKLEDYFGRVTYSGSHDRAIMAVQKGLVDGAYVSSLRLDEALRQRTLAAEDIKVLWKSAPIPHDPFVYRGNLCPNLVNAFKKDFFEQNERLLGMFRDMNITGYTRISDDDYKEIRDLFSNQR